MTYEEEKEQAIRQIAAHERAAARAKWAHKRAAHEEAIRYLCDKFNVPSPLAPPPEPPPPYAAIEEQLARIGMADQLQDFWRFHAGQGDGELGALNYEKAFMRLRDAARIAAGSYGRPVWIPACVEFSAPMQFVQVVSGTPKGEREWSTIERYSK
jgi:hypothetical protein